MNPILKSILLPLVLLPAICAAQTASTKIPIPMKKGKIYFEKDYPLNDSLQKKELFSRAYTWMKRNSPYEITDIKTDVLANTITGTGTGMFKIITSSTGNYYLVRFVVALKADNNGYSFSMYDLYEKPVESGISNEYSKIEYRWWDFRQGKPWSAEDETLFKGIVSDEEVLMTSFESKMNSGNN
jgi:hypothetical protein